MDVYFYNSYENSARGFFPVYLSGNGVIPADGSAGITIPEAVWDFFSYDKFQVLWRDFADKKTALLFPEPLYGIFGVRGMTGMVDGRAAAANMVIYAEEREAKLLEAAAMAVLNDYAGFERRVFGWMTIGGDYGYQINTAAFDEWLGAQYALADAIPDASDKSDAGRMLKKLKKQTDGYMTERDFLRFAVYSDDWSAAASYMGKSALWKIKPSKAISRAEFQRIFVAERQIF